MMWSMKWLCDSANLRVSLVWVRTINPDLIGDLETSTTNIYMYVRTNTWTITDYTHIITDYHTDTDNIDYSTYLYE